MNEPVITHSMVNTSSSHQGIDRIIDIEHYNNIRSLLRVTTYVIRFVNNLKTSQRSQRNLKELRADYLKNTKTLWIKSVQASAFIEELSFLNRQDHKATPPIWVTQFGLFLSKDHTIKCKGQINNASLLPSTKSPLLLPAKHTFISLLVKQAHDLVKHSGITATLTTLTTLRERFWVLRGRETVKNILQHCIVCRRYEIATCKIPQFADLPNHRVSEDPPFSHTGLDFARPLYVRGNCSRVEHDEHNHDKVYVCLFTCASTRVVHLELIRELNVPDLPADEDYQPRYNQKMQKRFNLRARKSGKSPDHRKSGGT